VSLSNVMIQPRRSIRGTTRLRQLPAPQAATGMPAARALQAGNGGAPRQPVAGPRVARGPRAVGRFGAVTGLWTDPFRLTLMALVIDNTSHVTSYLGPLHKIRPGLVLFCLAILFALSSQSKAINYTVFRWRIPKLIVLQGMIVCGSALFGISLGNSATSILQNYSKTFAVALLLMMSFRGIADVRRTVWALASAGVILAFLSIVVVHLSKENGAITWDANDVGLIMVMSLPFLLLLGQTSNTFGKSFAWIGAGLAVTTIIMSASRGAFLGIAAVGLALLVFLPGVSVVQRVAVVAAVVVGMVVFAPDTYWNSMRTITKPSADYNWEGAEGRREISKRGIGYMLQYPMFGVGMNNFPMAEGTISPLARRYANSRVGIKWSAPHNSWVQAGAETGISGLVVWAVLMVGSAITVIKLRRRLPRSWLKEGTADQRFIYLATLYVPIAFLGFLVCASFLSWAWNDPGYVLPAIALGLQKSIGDAVSAATVPGRSPIIRGRGALRPGMRRIPG
jgi:O-antigen ligase